MVPLEPKSRPWRSAQGGMVRPLYLSSVLLAMLAPGALADQVVLRNGDRLTGQVIRFDGKNLILKSEFAGEVTIQWSGIQQITSDQPLHVQSKSGQTAVGTITTSEGKVNIATRAGSTVAMPQEDIVLIRSNAEQSAYEQSVNPGVRENWDAGATVSFALTRGNSQSKNLALAFNADRKTLHDKLTLYTNSVYATNDAPGAVPSTTASAQQGGLRYDHDITPSIICIRRRGLSGRQFADSRFAVGVWWRPRFSRHQAGHDHSGSSCRHELHAREICSFHAQFRRGYVRRRIHAQVVWQYRPYAESLFLSRLQQYRRVSHHVQFRNTDQTQQVAGVAERVRRHLRQ
jgi:hypothetical protein